MNILLVMRDRPVVTPPLGRTILAGDTREYIMVLGRDRALDVEGPRYSSDDWIADAASGAMTEASACGTAATVAEIGTVRHVDGELRIGEGSTGRVTASLRNGIFAIKRYTVPDTRGWVRKIA